MKRVIFLFLVFAGLTFGSCRRQTVMPQFDIVVTDTVAVRGGIPCRFQYAFTSIANADEAPALQAIQESNMLYFFGLEHFQGGVQEAVDLSIGQFMDEYIGTLDESVPQWKPKWRWRSSPRPVWWIRCWSIRFRVRTIRAVRTVCTASIAIIIPLRAVMSWLCPTCSMRHDRRL